MNRPIISKSRGKSGSKIKCLIFLIFVLITHPSMSQENMIISTYNIRFDNPGDHGNLWNDRSPHLINLIKFHQMDLIGTQEGLYNQLEEMKEGLGFPYIGVGRDTGGTEGEFSAIFYNPEKIQVSESGTFWLSDTPDVPSKGWDAALNRICTWAKMNWMGVFDFIVFNVHYDHVGQEAREKSSLLILEKIKGLNPDDLPTIWMGDFNVDPENPAYLTVTNDGNLMDTREISVNPPVGNQGTFNAFDWDRLPDKIIDHIFVSEHFEVLRHGILTDNYGKKYPSDHFPVLVEIKRRN